MSGRSSEERREAGEGFTIEKHMPRSLKAFLMVFLNDKLVRLTVFRL